MAIATSIISLITGGTKVAEQILIKANTKESRKYVDEWTNAKKSALAAERKVQLEKAKPQDQQFDSVVEHFEQEAESLYKLAEVLDEAANKELERILATQG